MSIQELIIVILFLVLILFCVLDGFIVFINELKHGEKRGNKND